MAGNSVYKSEQRNRTTLEYAFFAAITNFIENEIK